MISLLTKNSISIRNQFHPASMSLSLTERGSTATLTVGPEAPSIAVGDWMRDETEPGKGIIWRAKSVETDYGTNTRTVQLEHIINTLKDTVMFGEIKGSTMGGKDTGVSALKAASYVIGRQSAWKLGSFGYSVTQPYSFNGDTLFSALETISSTLKDCWWSYDLSGYPFVLNIKAADTTVTAEMRMDRNIRTLRRTVDKTNMYTRVYPIGENNLHISGSYVQKNTGTYGVVSKVLTDTSKTTAAALKTWAQERLDRHCEPSVTVTVSGMDLSQVTGLSLDKLTLGKRCRVPLPEYNTTIEERISKIQWSDKIADPEGCTVTLANELADVASIVKSISESVSSGTSSRGGAKKAEEDHAWFVDTTDHVAMVAEAVAGPGAGTDWSRVAQILVDGTGIYQTVTESSKELGTVKSGLSATSGQVKQFVTAVGADGKITAASITLSINKAGSNARINADHITLTGHTTINDVLTVTDGRAYIKKKLRVNGDAMVESLTVRDRSSSVTLSTSLIEGMIKSASVSGNTLTLTPVRGDAINFSKAVTSMGYQWSNQGRLTVTAYPQRNSFPLLGVTDGGGSWDTSAAKFTGNIKYYEGSDDERTYNTGAQYTVYASSVLQSKSVSSNGTVTPDSNYIGLSSVTVSGVKSTPHNFTKYQAGATSSAWAGQLYRRTGSSPNYTYTALGYSDTYWYGIRNEDLGAYPTLYT